MTIAEFDDPRLAVIYETVNTHEPDEQPRFVRGLVDRLSPHGRQRLTIVDVGCGTGLITRELAGLGHEVIGVDPSAAMIAVGRTRPHGDRVRWIVGEVAEVGAPGADLAVMTSHVAQFFVADDEWDRALDSVHVALRPGGLLGFESRNPGDRAWERWNPDDVTSVVDPVVGVIDWWPEVHDIAGGVVRYSIHYRFHETGEVLTSDARLRFCTRDQLVRSLDRAGFEVERIDGHWDGRPADATSPEHIVLARCR